MSCATQEAMASPKLTRASSERLPLAPVTPQRINSLNKQLRTPSSPSLSSMISSPFTPITNCYSSASSLASPNSSISTKVDYSPETTKLKIKSIADTTNNWRTRAKENGIKVTTDNIGKEMHDSPKESIPASFLSTHRRARQSLFQTRSSDNTAFVTPKTTRMPIIDGANTAPIVHSSSFSASLLKTPEPAVTLSYPVALTTPSPRTSLEILQRMRQRGSLTDPARPRRRETFGSLSGEVLYDIDENSATNFSPFPQTFVSPVAMTRFNTSGMRSVSAPFPSRGYLAELQDEDEDYYDDDEMPSAPKHPKLRATKSVSSLSALTKDETKSDPDAPKVCSVCSASASPLSILVPCEHLICSSCLTGALNIVGEKDMRCTSCDKPVNDFKLLTPLKFDNPKASSDESKEILEDGKFEEKKNEQSSIEQLLPSVFDETLAPKEEKTESTTSPQTISPSQDISSTPNASSSGSETDVAVLRIDNVPWDITPPALIEFFSPHALTRAHVLLDPKGKTLSHAFVELPVNDARNALRSVQNKTMGKGRRMRGVTVTMSKQSELMRALFPCWLGSFEGTKPAVNGLGHSALIRTLENGLITFEEINGLMLLMRNPKSHFLKVPSLPFHSLVSIISKFPADKDSRVFWKPKLNEVLFEATFAGVQILIDRIGTDLHDQNLLEEVTRTAVDCRVFTNAQRRELHECIDKGVSARGGKLNLPPLSLGPDSVLDVMAEDAIPSDDSASSASVSTSSSRNGMRYSRLNKGRLPPPIHRYDNSITFANMPTYPNSPPPQFGVFPTSCIGSPVLSYGNLPMGINQSFGMSPTQDSFDMLAREFGVEADLVAALAQRLTVSSPGPVSNMLYPAMRM